MRQIKLFLTIIVFAVFSAFQFSLAAQPKLVTLKTKAEKISRVAAPLESIVSNFRSTDCLLMYETIRPSAELFTVRRTRFFMQHTFPPKNFAISKYFRTKPEFYWKVDFVQV